MDADDQMRLNAFAALHGAYPHFTTDRREQIVIADTN
jgi:hypothetical protein